MSGRYLVLRGCAALIVVAGGLLSAVPATAAPRYTGWVSDLLIQGYPPQRVLHASRAKTASGGATAVFLFVDRVGKATRWKVCVDRRDSRPNCATGLTGAPGRPSGRSLFPIKPGSYTATWTVGGRTVATYSFKVVP